MIVQLTRKNSDAQGTFGEMTLDGKHLCFTCEDPWNDNKQRESCIPTGTYICIPHSGSHFKGVWEVTKVPNRSAILIHQGNTSKYDTEGCILVGTMLGNIDGLPAVLGSRAALNLLRQTLPPTFTLEIS